MIDYKKIAGMGENRKKKKPKVKTKKDKPSRKVKTKTTKNFRIKEVNPFTKAVSVEDKRMDSPKKNLGYVEPGNINRPGPTAVTRRGRSPEYKSVIEKATSGEKLQKDIKEISKAVTKAGGGKVGNKYFTGGMVNPSYGTDFDDR